MWWRVEKFLRSPETVAELPAVIFGIKTSLTILATNNWHRHSNSQFMSVVQFGYEAPVARFKAPSVLQPTDGVTIRQ